MLNLKKKTGTNLWHSLNERISCNSLFYGIFHTIRKNRHDDNRTFKLRHRFAHFQYTQFSITVSKNTSEWTYEIHQETRSKCTKNEKAKDVSLFTCDAPSESLSLLRWATLTFSLCCFRVVSIQNMAFSVNHPLHEMISLNRIIGFDFNIFIIIKLCSENCWKCLNTWQWNFYHANFANCVCWLHLSKMWSKPSFNRTGKTCDFLR